MDVDAIASAEGKKAGKGFSDGFSAETQRTMQQVGTGMLAVGAIATVALGGAVKAASDLGESVNAVNVTFGDAAGGILELGENAATSVGLSASAFNGLAVQFSAFATTIAGEGGNVVATMDDLTTRGADFASVMNLDVNEAMTLFQSGLAGETEPLRKFGIDLSAASVESYAAANGIGTLGAELTETEKVQARYGSLMEQTNKTAGDFANTSDGLANQQRIMKAELENAAAALGSAFLPMMARAVGGVTDGIRAFSSLNDATGGAAGVLLAVTAVVGTLGGAALIAIPKIIAMKATMVSLGVTTSGAMAAMVPMIAVVAALGVGFAELKGFTADTTTELNGLSGFFQDLADDSYDLGNSLGDLVGYGDDTAAMLRADERESARLYGTMTEGIFTVKQLSERLAEHNVDGTTAALITVKFSEGLDKAKVAADNQAEALQEATVVTTGYQEAVYDVTEVNAAFEEQLQATRDANEALVQSMLDAVGGALSYEQSAIGLTSAYSDYEVQLYETMLIQQDSELSDREKEQAMRDLRSAEIDTAAAAFDTATAYAAEAGAVDGSKESIDLQVESLQAAQEKYPALREEIQVYIDDLNGIPREKLTGIEVQINPQKLSLVELALELLGRPRTVEYRPSTNISARHNATGSFVSGGSNLLTTVGELGGARGDEAILPLGDPARMRQLLGNSRIGPRVLDALGVSGGGGSSGGFGDGPITLIIEGEPITARIVNRERQLIGALNAGRRT